MTDRDRLLRVVKESLIKYIDKTCLLAENITNDLLANGILLPPCKNGDKVYFSKAELQEVCPAKVIAIKDNYYSPSCRYWITIEYDSQFIGKQTVEMTADVFKLLCHKTKEEAEQKLKERESGGK